MPYPTSLTPEFLVLEMLAQARAIPADWHTDPDFHAVDKDEIAVG